jgi:hypothetical protein
VDSGGIEHLQEQIRYQAMGLFDFVEKQNPLIVLREDLSESPGFAGFIPMIPFSGGCACGAIRYECSAEPIMMFKCHCRDCQQVTGGGFVAGLLVPASAFRLTKGQLCYHFTPSAAGGKHKRGFCAECGSRITGGQSDERPTEFVGVTAGQPGRSKRVSSANGFFRFRRTAVGPNGPGDSEIRTLSAAAKECVSQFSRRASDGRNSRTSCAGLWFIQRLRF